LSAGNSPAPKARGREEFPICSARAPNMMLIADLYYISSGHLRHTPFNTDAQ
jgi:hypothetical protein